jgi:hypothetical protein
MISRNGVELVFHHLGIATSEAKPGERYSEMFGMYTSDAECGLIHVQWHRYEPTSPLPPLMRTTPHPAFKVVDLERGIEGATILLGPYEQIRDYRVAVIEDGGIPIELIETTLSDEEIWGRARSDRTSLLYASTPKP